MISFKKLLVLPALLLFTTAFSLNAQAAGVDTQETVTPYPLAIDSSTLTADPRDNMLKIAASQVGYKEAQSEDSNSYKYSWYAKWTETNKSNWCSEFAAWCGYMAGMPEDLFPQCTWVGDYKKYFGEMGQVYCLDTGHPHAQDWLGEYYTKTITLSEVQPGDILSVRTNSSADDTTPKHTCIVRSVNLTDQTINTYDGNKGSGKLKGVTTCTYDTYDVFAVIKPMYELYPLDGISLNTADDGSVSLSWTPRDSVDGYRVYRIVKPVSGDADDDGYEMIAEITGSTAASYVDTAAVKGQYYFYKIVPYKVSGSGEKIDGFSFDQPAYSSETCQALPSDCSHRYLPQETVPGNCNTKNIVTYTCLYCGDSFTKREVYGNHNFQKSSKVNATQAEPGYYIYTCKYCGQSYTETYYASKFTVNGVKYHRITSSKVEVTGATKKSSRTSLTIPKTVKYNGKKYKVTRIASKAFRKYKKLKTVKINANLTEIRSRAFYGCKKLKEITFTSNIVPSINTKAFKGIDSKAVFYVPKATSAAYKIVLNTETTGRPSKSKIKQIKGKSQTISSTGSSK